MNDFKDMTEKLKNMSDAELEEAIRTVGAALGADERALARISRERSTLKRKLANADERDLAGLAAKLSPDQLETIKRALSGGGQ